MYSQILTWLLPCAVMAVIVAGYFMQRSLKKLYVLQNQKIEQLLQESLTVPGVTEHILPTPAVFDYDTSNVYFLPVLNKKLTDQKATITNLTLESLEQ